MAMDIAIIHSLYIFSHFFFTLDSYLLSPDLFSCLYIIIIECHYHIFLIPKQENNNHACFIFNKV